LDEVLTEVRIAGYEAGGAQQPRTVIGDEVGELVVPLVAHWLLRWWVVRR
jgi:hypothetical protein